MTPSQFSGRWRVLATNPRAGLGDSWQVGGQSAPGMQVCCLPRKPARWEHGFLAGWPESAAI
eukprot:CAMPEP_0196593948 /NCGR_PEP_ID=MMETSP1081-20130531/76990_1 /TAXON_ID=36882 /ORGANISM="Pyramimonas amylifera, Strain CCMP720" /LENGTH=61 /DNA_ID=CAMNT_0041918075 /DNA_START=290 /DNA_END=475 /DNA_ORIENTATION=+